MDTRTNSPRRAHILASINQERCPLGSTNQQTELSPNSEHYDIPSGCHETVDDHHGLHGKAKTRSSRLRLKNSEPRRKRQRCSNEPTYPARPSRRHSDHHQSQSPPRRRHRRSRHKDHHKRPPTPLNPYDPEPLDSDAAFRESLFDALADDDGAAYWEGIYGQPIHIYAEPDSTSGNGPLDRMNEEEYASYVRQKMWEKTHAGALEQRAQQDARRKATQAALRLDKQRKEQMDQAFRDEQKQRLSQRWRKRYDEYIRRWDDVPINSKADAKHPSAETILPWPVDSGRREDIDRESVQRFFLRGLARENVGETAFAAKLKEERVKWHPDKIQQRLGGRVEQTVMRDVTSVFQSIDSLWLEARGAQNT